MILFIFVMLMFFVMFYNDIMYHNYINHTKIYHIDVNELIQEYNRSRIDFHHKIEPKVAYK